MKGIKRRSQTILVLLNFAKSSISHIKRDFDDSRKKLGKEKSPLVAGA